MIRGMWKRVLAALIILGCISLSGFDVVEDLDEVPGQSQLSEPLPNNIIESASRTKATTFEAVTFSPIIFHYVGPAEFRKHSLHKLFRVFLV
jgi:hypothetical protein